MSSLLDIFFFTNILRATMVDEQTERMSRAGWRKTDDV
jgi:hypothetical protein